MKGINDFPMKEKSIIYFDNAATTFKPYRVINKINEYYTEYNANSHRGDYDISFKVDDEIDYTRDLVKMFINAKRKDEIIFTKNTTDSINLVAFGFFLNYLNDGDEIILSSSEHASNLLPWMILSVKKKIKINFVDSKNEKLDIEDLKSKISYIPDFASSTICLNIFLFVINVPVCCSYISSTSTYPSFL